MRTTSTLLGLTLLALAGSARGEEAASAASAAPAAVPSAGESAAASQGAKSEPAAEDSTAATSVVKARKLQLGLAFLPMAAGKIMVAPSGRAEETDAAFAYGLGLSLDYLVWDGLSVGLAPQMSLNVKAKSGSGQTAKQADLLLRVAYSYSVVDNIRIYAEVLPGYSLLLTDDTGKGFVLVLGAGVATDLTDRVFVNVGAGYEMGFQKFSGRDDSTRFIRVALGGGVRF